MCLLHSLSRSSVTGETNYCVCLLHSLSRSSVTGETVCESPPSFSLVPSSLIRNRIRICLLFSSKQYTVALRFTVTLVVQPLCHNVHPGTVPNCSKTVKYKMFSPANTVTSLFRSHWASLECDLSSEVALYRQTCSSDHLH